MELLGSASASSATKRSHPTARTHKIETYPSFSPSDLAASSLDLLLSQYTCTMHLSSAFSTTHRLLSQAPLALVDIADFSLLLTSSRLLVKLRMGARLRRMARMPPHHYPPSSSATRSIHARGFVSSPLRFLGKRGSALRLLAGLLQSQSSLARVPLLGRAPGLIFWKSAAKRRKRRQRKRRRDVYVNCIPRLERMTGCNRPF